MVLYPNVNHALLAAILAVIIYAHCLSFFISNNLYCGPVSLGLPCCNPYFYQIAHCLSFFTSNNLCCDPIVYFTSSTNHGEHSDSVERAWCIATLSAQSKKTGNCPDMTEKLMTWT